MTIRRMSACPAIAALLCGTLASAPAHAAPPNDLCANAQLITVAALNTPVTVTGTNVNANSDLAQSTCAFNDDLDVWYRLTASITADYTFDTFDSLLEDTTLAVYNACGGISLGCNDDANGGTLWSQLTVHLTAGQSVRIRVAGYDDSSDAFNLNVIATVRPSNDSCAAAEPIAIGQIKTGNNAGADTDIALDSTVCGTFDGSGGVKDVFYAFTPAATGSYHVSLCASTFDTVLAVLADCNEPQTILACNDDSTACTVNGSASDIPAVMLTGGVTYLIRVAGYDNGIGGVFGDYSLVITSNTPPAGVCCRGSTCNASIAQGACVTPGTGFAGAAFFPAAACNTTGNATTPCCYADYNKANSVTVQDIFDYLSDWFASSPFAATGGDGSPTPLSVQAIFDFLNAWFAGC